ncbi:MAG: fibrobacter succinogenes major paralogous domain-containing protein, partial [Patescibacteria group bacterium]|nr:fibrobacter succinogenes major paralogous domain-containing protein [Patescibacteria group bacterium]
YYDKDGNVVGTFSLEVSVPQEGTHVVEVRSTGWSIDNPTSKRTIQVYFGYESFSDSAFVINTAMWFSETSFVHGKTFSNGCIRFDGGSDSWVDSAQGAGDCSGNDGVYGSGGPTYFWRYDRPVRSFDSVSSDFTALKNMANQSTGINLGTNNREGWHLKFKDDGTFDTFRVNNINSTNYDITSEFIVSGNRPIPVNGVIYAPMNIWVDGVVNGRVTVVADNDYNIYLPGNLTYKEKYSDDVLGLLADKDILLTYSVPNNMEVNGALLARTGSIGRKYTYYSVKNSFNFFGSQIAYENRYGMKHYNYFGQIDSGFINTSYTYDGNLLYQPPIGIPVIPQYKLISWQEVQTGTGAKICQTSACNDETSIVYSGKTYGLVEIGNQCWFAENLNVGNMLASGSTMPSNSSVIEKWCYNNSSANCTTYGGLYTWAEALQLATSCNTSSCSVSSQQQGICPVGWHVPSDDEFKILETSLSMCAGSSSGCVDATGLRGTDQGTQIKVGGSSGLNALLAGGRNSANSFSSLGSVGSFWLASQYSATYGWRRYITSGTSGIYREGSNIALTNTKILGQSVRCVKN